ncbi:hypothetical protein [Leisingera sp. S232]|uniref:hypothetical protein n=1 Tax=Leisingera sp. S232 TaxID=3415132 RepID=UPI003C7CE66F
MNEAINGIGCCVTACQPFVLPQDLPCKSLAGLQLGGPVVTIVSHSAFFHSGEWANHQTEGASNETLILMLVSL